MMPPNNVPKKPSSKGDMFSPPAKPKPPNLRNGGNNMGVLTASVAGGVALIVLLVILIATSSRKSNTSSYNQKRGSENNQDESARPAPTLPEGRLGELAKGVVYIYSSVERYSDGSKGKSGTGFIVSQSGDILTNEHVVSEALDVTVVYYDGTSTNAKIIKKNKELDVAHIRAVPAQGVNVLRLSDREIAGIGRRIIVLGFPLGYSLGSEISLTNGLISSIRKDNEGNLVWYQVNAAINPGNSGGPLIDEVSGEVLGIVTAKISEAENIGFARPLTIVREKFRYEFN